MFDLVKEHFVPVGIDVNYIVTHRQDAEGVFYRNRVKGTRNGFIVTTPNGRELSSGAFVTEAVGPALQAWAQLPADQRKPGMALEDHGAFDPSQDITPDPGTVIVRVSVRKPYRDERGEFRLPDEVHLFTAPSINQQPQRDFLWMTKEEARSLVAPGVKKGQTYRVPRFLSERLFRYHVYDKVS